jgi:hypothetical protein
VKRNMKIEVKQEILNEKQDRLSEKAKENLEKNKRIRKEDSIFLSIDPEEEVILEFNPELIEIIEDKFNGVTKRKIRYSVIEQTSKKTKYWAPSQWTSKKIDSYLAKGETVLKIKRTGSKLDTIYHFSIP